MCDPDPTDRPGEAASGGPGSPYLRRPLRSYEQALRERGGGPQTAAAERPLQPTAPEPRR